MSRVCLIAADKPLPLCDRQEERTSAVSVNGVSHTISFVRGFRVAEHRYYRSAVDVLHLPLKPFQYELELEHHEDDLMHLKDYLSRNFRPGETVELWNIWVGVDRQDPPFQRLSAGIRHGNPEPVFKSRHTAPSARSVPDNHYDLIQL